MGLCKCPKKKVTNLFCFEHRVNVCEHCLTANHTKCIVQSYLQWLQDSDYDPNCKLCGRNLADEDCGECIRLTCYDVFHWNCLDSYARRLPANTAPAGYTCPSCSTGIFPAPNVASPVADCLRKVLTKVNWARAGLGLPLIEDTPAPESPVNTRVIGPAASAGAPATQRPINVTQNNSAHIPQHAPAVHANVPGQRPNPTAYALPQSAPPPYLGQGQSVVNMDDHSPYNRGTEKAEFNPRKLFDTTKGDGHVNMSHDHDEDKYKRRPALQWFARWFESRTGKQRSDPNAVLKRFLVLLVIGLLGFITVVMIFSRVGRASAEGDPFLDPMANPNIRVEEN